jgi:hypothetical protein
MEPGLTLEYLASLSFATVTDNIGYLKELAQRSGFRLSQRDRKTDSYVRLCCSLASRGQGWNKSRKTGCSFRVCPSEHFESDATIYGIHPRMFLKHNHPVHPAQVQNLTDDVRNVVKRMKVLRITTFQIYEFVLGNYGIPLTPTDVDTVTIYVDPGTTLVESEALMTFLADTVGTGETYFVTPA